MTDEEELYNLGPNTVGFPREVHRRVDLTVTEPRLIVTKEVCNETRYGAGPACSNFVTLADDGDAYDTYVYRVTVANEASSWRRHPGSCLRRDGDERRGSQRPVVRRPADRRCAGQRR